MIPNLDALTVHELEDWASNHHRRRSLFPGGGKGTVLATRNLVAYAWNKATAQRCRLNGDIDTALMYEGICERIYDQLPKEARW